MSSPDDNEPILTATAASLPTVAAVPSPLGEASPAQPQEPPRVGPRYVWLMVLAQFGVFMAFITPMAISLTIRVNNIAPDHPEYLGIITSAGALVVMIASPFTGVWSDRTRARIGRRRPFMIGGMLVGVVSLLVMATAPNVMLLGIGWILAQLGWGTALSNLQTSQADRLPESQRGKVAGLSSFATQIAPVFGVVLAQFFTGDPLLLFLVPGAVGIVFVLLFVTLVHEDDARALPRDPMDARQLLGKYLFKPNRYPDFSWNWLGRFLFTSGVTLNTTYTAYFFAARLGITVEEVATLVATVSFASIVAVTVGAIGGGFLSDRLKRRRPFVLLGGVIMAAGMLTQAFAPSAFLLITGSLIASVGLGTFSAVDQALTLDVLPERDTDAGRFLGIMAFATALPQSAAPLLASGLLLVGVSGGDRNYPLVFCVAAGFAIAGGLIVLRIRSVR